MKRNAAKKQLFAMLMKFSSVRNETISLRLYKLFQVYYNIPLLSNTENHKNTEELSKKLAEPEWLLAWRNKQLEHADTLPVNEKYGIAIAALEAGEVNFSANPDYKVEASKGLELYTWKEAMAQEEIAAILERLLMSELLPPAASRDAALGRAYFEAGLVVYVQPTVDEKGEYKKETLTLETAMPLGAGSDLIIVIGKEGSRFSMKSIVKGGEASSVLARTLVTLLEGDAEADIYTTTDNTKGFVTIEQTALVPAHAVCNFIDDPKSEMKYRSRTNAILLGEYAESEIVHVLVGIGTAHFDIWAGAEHRASLTKSRIYALGLGTGESKLVYRGAIDMKKDVLQVDGAQEGKFLVASPKAEVSAIPMLDIASKEVASTHKLSISHIRDVDLFYAKSRGMSEEDARELAVEGFFASLLEQLAKEDIMNDVRSRIHNLTDNIQGRPLE